MRLSLLAALCIAPLSLAALSAPAQAASVADLVTTFAAPTGSPVGVDDTWSVTVANTGNRDAYGVTLDIQLPETHTSPTVHVMGDLGAMSSACVQSGTTLSCDLGRIRRARSATVSFDTALPWSAAPLDFAASAATTTAESDLSDNDDSATADLAYEDLVIAGPAAATVEHCTGTGLTAYFECELYPSSISIHEQVFDAGGTLSFPLYGPDYGGAWDQDDGDDSLYFEITELGTVIAVFEGNAVDGACFEGLTHFIPDGGYVSPYRVCLD